MCHLPRVASERGLTRSESHAPTVMQVIRAGEILEMSTRQLLVGDVVLLEAGDKIPADGVLTQGDDVSVNESSLTGEAEDVRKGGEEGAEDQDVFMLSGCTLTSGRATMIVIAVGAESRWGRIKVSCAALVGCFALGASMAIPHLLRHKLSCCKTSNGYLRSCNCIHVLNAPGIDYFTMSGADGQASGWVET